MSDEYYTEPWDSTSTKPYAPSPFVPAQAPQAPQPNIPELRPAPPGMYTGPRRPAFRGPTHPLNNVSYNRPLTPGEQKFTQGLGSVPADMVHLGKAARKDLPGTAKAVGKGLIDPETYKQMLREMTGQEGAAGLGATSTMIIPGMATGKLLRPPIRAPLNQRILNQSTRQARKHGGYVDDAAINSKFRNSQELWKDGLKIDKDNNVVLQRWADNENHMTKDWQPANQGSLKDTSRVTGGGGGLPTSVADAGFGTGAGKTMGEFKIPAKEFPKAFKDKNAIFGNVGEGEFVLNPAWAKQYYQPVKSNWSPPPKNLTPEPPGAIYLD